MAKGEELGDTGFKLSVTMAEIHVPRMWVEELPDDANDCVSFSLTSIRLKFYSIPLCL